MNTRTRDPFITTLVILFIVVTVFCIMYTVFSHAFEKVDPVYYETYVVQSYDSLWTVASMSDGYGELDTRRIIEDIKDMNNIGDVIYPDQVVYVPMYNNH